MQRLCGLFVCLCITAGGCANMHASRVTPVTAAPITPPPISPTVACIEPSSVDVWDVIRGGLALDHDIDQPSVARAVGQYLAASTLMPSLESRANRYFAYVVAEVRERNLPMELALLPIVESTLNPYAFSEQGAAGLWQLIPSTARRHGVTIDWWYDGRRDLVDSTNAALDYLTYLHDRFGDWLLALAAYNAGEGRVRGALRANPSADFFHLDLPRETRRYVPRVLALAHLIDSNDALDLPALDANPPFFVTTLNRQIDLQTLLSDSALSLDDIFVFNPGLNRRATPPDRPFRMLIPANLRVDFEKAIDRYPTDAPRWRHHVVRPGESLGQIARRYQSSVAAIRKQNALTGSLIRPGQVLVIPQVERSYEALASNPLLPSGAVWQRYKTRSGDSLWTISRKFHTTIAALAEANQLHSTARLRVGQVLAIPGRPASQRIVYTVKRGDSLARIAVRYRVSVAQIAGWNGVDPSDILHPGAQLVLHVPVRSDWT